MQNSSPPLLQELLRQALESDDLQEQKRLLLRMQELAAGEAQQLGRGVQRLHSVLMEKQPAAEPPPDLCQVEGFGELYGALLELRVFILALANGDLSQTLRMKGYTAGALKMLQAHLNHLTWQAQTIAQGDFSQRVDFMGDFSQAFNSMVEQLSATLEDLRHKEQELTRANTELQQEVKQRRQTEEELRRSQERYRQLASTDPLTGLANRRRFFSLALMELQRCCRYGSSLALVMLDVDHFKNVNDTHGHAVGDLVLQGVAARARETLRQVDLLARYGGEEFVALLPETDHEGAESLAERLRLSLDGVPLSIGTGKVSITASFGVCAYRPEPGCQSSPELLEKLVNLADKSLYEAKRAGRNRVAACRYE